LRLPPQSYQLSAFSGQLLDEDREHAFDFSGFLGKLVVIGGWKEMEVSGEQQVILQFTGGTTSDPTEAERVPRLHPFRSPPPSWRR
jgi:hypothetical protein